MRETISKLFREVELDVGASDFHLMALDALRSTIVEFKSDKIHIFLEKFEELFEFVKQTEPKFAIIIDFFDDVLLLCKEIAARENTEGWKRDLILEIDKLELCARQNIEKLIEAALKIDVDGKTILIHDHSHTVYNVLRAMKKHKRKFEVIVAEQDYEKTGANIAFLDSMKIPFEVVPAYMLSHIEDRVDMLFFGAVTLKSTFDFVMAPGTHAVIAEFSSADIPIYMFIETAKWSLWKAEPKDSVFVHRQQRVHHVSDIPFDRIKYSHDRVPLHFFNKVVTEEGAQAPAAIEELYRKKQKGRS